MVQRSHVLRWSSAKGTGGKPALWAGGQQGEGRVGGHDLVIRLKRSPEGEEHAPAGFRHDSFGSGSIECDAAATPGAVGNLRRHRQAAKFEQQFAEARALFHVHIDEFKSHGLGSRATN